MFETEYKKPRDLTKEEIEQFKLNENNKEKYFETTGLIFSEYHNKYTSTYRIYVLGTNYRIFLRYTPLLNKWEEIKIENIPYFIIDGIFQYMKLRIDQLEYEIKRELKK